MGAKLFGTDGVRGKANIYPMTAEFALRLATAAGQLVCNKERRVAIGRIRAFPARCWKRR